MKVTLILCAIVAIVLAEPPVPSSQYLPSNQYSTTSQDSFAPPSSQYGAPSRSYGAPSQTTQAVIRPNSQYGAPSKPSNQYGPPSNQYGAPKPAYLPPGGGYPSSNGGYDDQSEPANYQFEYHVQDSQSGNDFGHEESRQGDVAKGKYYVLLPDGRRQVVEYTADSEGYKPKISYEQVGGGYPSGGPGGYPSGGPGNGGYNY